LSSSLLLTKYPTVPDPTPDAPEVIVIQSTEDVAVHLHPSGAVTDTVPVPPCLLKDALSGFS
jgi:hypothetical protein